MEESRRFVVGSAREIAGRRIVPVAEISFCRHGDNIIGRATLKAVVVQDEGEVYALGLTGDIPLEALLCDVPDLKAIFSQEPYLNPT